ncbi:5-oxoprolinase subunit PxpB [Mucilaginibacter limnophilus]|uniref:5-oxoprolinase subunit PxpB n=1 Tax=Mucilaginibacter limnophilus TaxID=1932778 RepID=A0A437MFR9_9SPHI|nr:5-oxoprolinase subunit PxpB [Mucilaginibacter limnophilus]RVT96496.1 5-oxoprolinase subunit PxpB [Mucilaginibacter limnophilus]
MDSFNIYQLNENAVTIEFGKVISEDRLQTITAFNHKLQQHPFPGFVASVPAYCTLTVHFDYLQVSRWVPQKVKCFEKVNNYLTELYGTLTNVNISYNKPAIEIPVCYNAEFGTDIDTVSQITGIPVDEVIKIHTSKIYMVHMIGFIPGFAYLGGMDKRLNVPRKAKVNTAVPAGAVGIAGEQTGIYPFKTPGGWQIIGCTPIEMFDINRAQSSYLKAGDRIKFKSVIKQEFEQYSRQ